MRAGADSGEDGDMSDFLHRRIGYAGERLSGLPPGPPSIGARVGAALSFALLAAAIAVIYVAMRAVMEVGGTCASGGPYVVEQECPGGTAALMALAFPTIFAAGGAFLWFGGKLGSGVPYLAAIGWPALFLSCGWNFLEFGISPPGGGGADAGWLVCAVVFALLGVPVLLALPGFVRRVRERRTEVLLVLGAAALAGAAAGLALAHAVS